MNKLLNARLKYEIFDDVSILKKATCNVKDTTVSEEKTSATKNGGKLSQGIEQGSGKMKHNACVCFKPNMREVKLNNGLDQRMEPPSKSRTKSVMKLQYQQKQSLINNIAVNCTISSSTC